VLSSGTTHYRCVVAHAEPGQPNSDTQRQ
jgi:hypothetical protein